MIKKLCIYDFLNNLANVLFMSKDKNISVHEYILIFLLCYFVLLFNI